MTYDELSQAVQDYLVNSEATMVANMPVFCETVENRIYNEAQLPALRKNVTGYMNVGNRYQVMPTDFLSVFSFAVIDPTTGDYEYLMYKDVNYIREVYPSPHATAKPKVFGLFDTSTLILGPSPDKAYGVEMHYFYYPESIVTAGESWVSKNFPTVMLYGMIAEAYRFEKGETTQQQIYDTQYREALNLLRKLGEGVQRDDAFSTTTIKPKANLGE